MAAYNGIVDVVYYGTASSSDLDLSATWHVYLAQLAGSSFAQTQVNANPNHHGVICTGGTGCGPGTRNLLDLFQVAVDPVVGKAAIIYTDDTITTSNSPDNFACPPGEAPPCPLPQAVLASNTECTTSPGDACPRLVRAQVSIQAVRLGPRWPAC